MLTPIRNRNVVSVLHHAYAMIPRHVGGMMLRSDLVAKLHAENPTLNLVEVEQIVHVFFEEISSRLEAGGRVELRGFGAFTTRARTGHIGRNPRTGDVVTVPAKRAVHFRPGREISARIQPKSRGDQP